MEIMEIVKKISKKAAHFPDGKIDYSSEDVVAKFSCLVMTDKGLVVLRRADNGLWEAVTGYIDEIADIGEMIKSEVLEETGLEVKRLMLGEVFSYQSGEREYFIQPAIAYCEGEPKLNWEHSGWRVYDKSLQTTELFRKTLEAMKGFVDV